MAFSPFCVDTPETQDYGQQTRETLDWQLQNWPRWVAAEQQAQPQLAELQAKNIGIMMGGTSTTPGLAQLYRQYLPELSAAEQQATQSQREADIAAVEQLGGRATAAMLAANPQQQALINALNAQAQQDLALGGRMDPAIARYLQQQTMGAASNRGWGYNPGDLAAAQVAATGYGDQLQQQRFGRAAQVAGINQAVAGDPFMTVLSRQGQSFGAINNMGNQAIAGVADAGTSVFNPESAYAGNLYNVNSQNKLGADMFNSNQWMRMHESIMNAGGGLGGAALCWVAREVFGETNPLWLEFRYWLHFNAPPWFFKFYGDHGPAIAAWLKRHPWAKPAIRWWMTTRIAKRRRHLESVTQWYWANKDKETSTV